MLVTYLSNNSRNNLEGCSELPKINLLKWLDWKHIKAEEVNSTGLNVEKVIPVDVKTEEVSPAEPVNLA